MIKTTLCTIFILANIAIGSIFTSCNNSKTPSPVPIITYASDTVKQIVFLKHPKSNLLFVEVTLNKKSCYFLLDTGAILTVLDYTQSDEYNLNTILDDGEFNGMGGTNKAYNVTNTNSIIINNISYDIKLKSADISNVVSSIEGSTGYHITGILGSDFFSKYNAVFDFKNNVFFLRK